VPNIALELKEKFFFCIYLEELCLKCAHDLRFVCCVLSSFRFTVSDFMSIESIDNVCVCVCVCV
jgi:hypothetical protein